MDRPGGYPDVESLVASDIPGANVRVNPSWSLTALTPAARRAQLAGWTLLPVCHSATHSANGSHIFGESGLPGRQLGHVLTGRREGRAIHQARSPRAGPGRYGARTLPSFQLCVPRPGALEV